MSFINSLIKAQSVDIRHHPFLTYTAAIFPTLFTLSIKLATWSLDILILLTRNAHLQHAHNIFSFIIFEKWTRCRRHVLYLCLHLLMAVNSTNSNDGSTKKIQLGRTTITILVTNRIRKPLLLSLSTELEWFRNDDITTAAAAADQQTDSNSSIDLHRNHWDHHDNHKGLCV